MTAHRTSRWIRYCVLALALAAASCGITEDVGDDAVPDQTDQSDQSDQTDQSDRKGRPEGSEDIAGAEVNEHWHAAFAISVCGTFIEPLEDLGDDKDGIHTHGDGLIHIHPFTEDAAGPNATLAVFFEQVGIDVDGDRLRIDGDAVPTDECGSEPELRLAVWDRASTADESEPDAVLGDDLDSMVLADQSALTLALGPVDVEIEPPPTSSRLCDVAGADGPSEGCPSSSSSTVPSGSGSGTESVAGEPCAPSADSAGSGAPQAELPRGVPPDELVVEDVTIGDGAEAGSSGTVVVDYVMFACSTGKVVDSSWQTGEQFRFDIGTGTVIPGFEEGVIGMRVGGRRRIVVPPALGYADAGTSGIAPGETLVVVIDLRSVG